MCHSNGAKSRRREMKVYYSFTILIFLLLCREKKPSSSLLDFSSGSFTIHAEYSTSDTSGHQMHGSSPTPESKFYTPARPHKTAPSSPHTLQMLVVSPGDCLASDQRAINPRFALPPPQVWSIHWISSENAGKHTELFIKGYDKSYKEHWGRYVGRGTTLPCPLWGPQLSQHLHVVTNPETLWTPHLGAFTVASSERQDWSWTLLSALPSS